MRALLHTDRDSVVHPGNTRRRPRRSFGLLPLGPRLYCAAQDDLATVGLHGNATRIDLGAASEGILDLAANLVGRHFWLQCDGVRYAFDAADPLNRAFGTLARIVPLDRSLECDLAVL